MSRHSLKNAVKNLFREFDKNRLQEILVQYKKDFSDYVWSNERYKWVAVQNFQDNWDVNAENFAPVCQKAAHYLRV